MKTIPYFNDGSQYTRRRERLIDALRLQIYQLLLIKYSLVFCGVWLFLWGAFVLVLRFTNTVPWTQLWWGAPGLFFMPIVANLQARKKLPEKRTLCATLEKKNYAGGLLVSSLETELGDWEKNIPELALPTAHWDGRKTCYMTALAMLFVLIAFLLPDSSIVAEYRKPLNIEDRVNVLSGQIETLEEENILEVEAVEALKMNLENIQNNAEGEGPVKTLDALDHLEKQLQQKAEEAAEQGLKETEILSNAEALTEQVQKHAEKYSDSMSAEESNQLMQGLAEMLNEMFDEDAELFEKLEALNKANENSNSDGSDKDSNDADSKKSEKDGKIGKRGDKKNADSQKIDAEMLKKMLQERNLENLSKEQLEQLKEAMQQCKECNREMMEKLMERGMIDMEMLNQFEELEKVDEEELQRLLDELGCCEGGDGDGECEGDGEGNGKGRPGRGGISRGRGDAPITFEDQPASEEGTDFQSKILPPPALEELKNSLKFGTSRSAPEQTPAGTPPGQGGALQNIQDAPGSAHGQTILPQHRGPIGRYFER